MQTVLSLAGLSIPDTTVMCIFQTTLSLVENDELPTHHYDRVIGSSKYIQKALLFVSNYFEIPAARDQSKFVFHRTEGLQISYSPSERFFFQKEIFWVKKLFKKTLPSYFN